jgi:hypothetical protein
MIASVNTANGRKILVIDPFSLKIMNTVCQMHELLEENITCTIIIILMT